jgi:D-3-phosphoglycerate dehydrogenase / 2-oxoglutarate reductase
LSNPCPAVPPRRYHILNLEPFGYCDEAREVLGRLGAISEGPLSRRELLERVSAYEILIVRLQHQIDRDVFEAGKSLKAVVSATTGLDHIDLEAARARDVAVLSLKGEDKFLHTITATAEHTWALLLAVMRRIPEACDSVRAGQWDRDALKGRDLAGKRLGIVGLGRLGKQIASYGSAFRMKVAAYDPYVDTWPSTVVRTHSLPDLLTESDVLTVHVDLNPRTLKLIGRPELAALPRGAVLVNTSRGQVLDEAALLDALVSGQIRGAGLDVLAEERVFEGRRDNRLVDYARHHHNLLITPHIGGATHEAMGKTEVFMAHKLAQFLHGAQA